MAAIRPGRPAAKKQAAAPTEAAPPPPPPAAPRGRGMTIPAIVVAVALLGAAFLMRGGSSDKGAATQATSTASTAPPVDGAVVALDPITMNLASGDILKVGIALQLSATADAAKATKDPAAFGARALDETISVLGGYTKSELAGNGKADAKAKLSARVAGIYQDEVVGVYFTQFVIP